MKMTPAFLLVLALGFPLAGFAQWQWIDGDGRKVYSDRPPPPDIAEKNILKQPSAASRTNGAPAVAAVPDGGGAAKALGKDPVLEARRKQTEDEEIAKRKSASDLLSKDKSQNCERARNTLAVLKSGIRMKAPNAKGEVEYLNDADRSSEIERVQGIVTSDCK
jgi:hypothetical protein